MNAAKILKAICLMAEEDNKGLMMTLKVLNACTKNEVSEVTFQVIKDVVSSAGFQSVGLAGDYMCCAFFINRRELEKYKKIIQ